MTITPEMDQDLTSLEAHYRQLAELVRMQRTSLADGRLYEANAACAAIQTISLDVNSLWNNLRELAMQAATAARVQ